MLAVEIILILIGVAFLVGSYFVEERFSEKDLQEISKMSETQLNMIVEKQVKSARTQVENSVEEIIDDSLAITKRGLEKETNEKIMAISEYSDTVLETMNKTHNEIMFLYSMLNDKHAEMTEFAGALQKYAKPAKAVQQEYIPPKSEVSQTEYHVEETAASAVAREEAVSSHKQNKHDNNTHNIEETQDSMLMNKNEQILQLHKNGKSDVEIAKALDCGLGEVKLVLGLYKEEL